MNIFLFSIFIFYPTGAMIDVGLAGLSQLKVRFNNYNIKEILYTVEIVLMSFMTSTGGP